MRDVQNQAGEHTIHDPRSSRLSIEKGAFQMDFAEYQRRALATDQNPKPEGVGTTLAPEKHDIIPLLGLVGEVGALLGEYKKLLRDGETHRKFRDEVEEELGDILWYVANVATKFRLNLNDIALGNLKKTEDRWIKKDQRPALYDANLFPSQQFPRKFMFGFEERVIDGVRKLVLVDHIAGQATGSPLTDNAYIDDGYRFHDVIHLSFAACLGWSPVMRKLLRNAKRIERRTPAAVDEVEDGGRAQVIEEVIANAAYVYAADHNYLEGINAIDWQLLNFIRRLCSQVEVSNRTTKEWNDALLQGFSVWRDLRKHGGGFALGDLDAGTIKFIPPPQ